MDESIDFVCAKCNCAIEAPAEMAGQSVECPNCKNALTVPVRHAPEAKEEASPSATFGRPYVLYASLLFNLLLALTALGVALLRNPAPTATNDIPAVYDVLTARRLVLIGDEGAKIAELGQMKVEGQDGFFPQFSLYNPFATSAEKKGIELTSGFGLNTMVFYDRTGNKQVAVESNNNTPLYHTPQSNVSLFDKDGRERLQLLVTEGSPTALSVHTPIKHFAPQIPGFFAPRSSPARARALALWPAESPRPPGSAALAGRDPRLRKTGRPRVTVDGGSKGQWGWAHSRFTIYRTRGSEGSSLLPRQNTWSAPA